MQNYKMRGDPVNLSFSSADASSIASMVITDTQGTVRTLAANEQLNIETLIAFTALSGTNRVEVFSDDDSGSDVDDSEIIATFGVGNGAAGFPGEGRGLKVGKTPGVKATASGLIRIDGLGHITTYNDTTTRPSWKESLVPGH